MSVDRLDTSEIWRVPRVSVGEMPRRGRTISPEMPIMELERIFLADPLLTSVVVCEEGVEGSEGAFCGDHVDCIPRAWFFHHLIGRLGFGRSLYSRHRVKALPLAHTLTLPAETRIVDATKAVLERPEVHRYDDIVIRFADGSYSTVCVAELFAELAHTHEYEGLHDSLTGLPNRRLFFNRLSAAHSRAMADRDSVFAVLFIDIDDFKTINDGLGHHAGDRALVETARRLCRLLAPGITIARLGGDEFGMLIEPTGGDLAAQRTAERVAIMMSRPMELGDETVALTASVGVAIGPDDTSPDELMRNADLAMYSVKHRQKGHHAFYEQSMHTRAREELELRAQLEGALERDEFQLVFQPVVELEGQTILGAEVLLRWERPGQGTVGPARFIPMCEQTGAIVPIGRWVLQEACRRAAVWGAAHPGHRELRLSVNISPRQLQEPDFVADVQRILDATGMPGTALVLEITESVWIENLHDVAGRLSALKELGVRLALDDFGTGFSSLGYLTRMPIDMVKLDRTFVRQLGASADRGLLRGIVALARSLDLNVVAEGVETEEQARVLRAAGCDRAQGYYFARPLSGPDYAALLGEADVATTLPAAQLAGV